MWQRLLPPQCTEGVLIHWRLVRWNSATLHSDCLSVALSACLFAFTCCLHLFCCAMASVHCHYSFTARQCSFLLQIGPIALVGCEGALYRATHADMIVMHAFFVCQHQPCHSLSACGCMWYAGAFGMTVVDSFLPGRSSCATG